MKMQSSAFALAAFLLTGVADLGLHAAPIVSELSTAEMGSDRFNSLFKPIAGASALSAAYQFMKTPTTGAFESQVFQGTGSAAGLYAYAYQIVVNPVIDAYGQPTSVNSASLTFNSSPIATNLVDGSSASYSAYFVKDGGVGGLDAPLAGPGGIIQTPSSIALTTGSSSKSLTFQYLDPKTGAGPLEAGSRSATIVVISSIPFTTQSVSLQNSNPQISYPIAYSPMSTAVPEPATLLGWAGVIVGAALLRHRRNRPRA